MVHPVVGSANFQALHLYMSSVVFARLKDDYNLRAVPGHSIRYFCGVRDEVINQIGPSVLSEMMSPTAAGRMLVETSSLLLAARLAHAHAETELIRLPILTPHRLDDGRLRRVLAYVEEHLAEDIAVADLANVACLSIFHFTRAFAATMGVPPHRYVSQRRLETARAMITTGRASLSQIALRMPVFLAIELHPRVPAGNGRDTGRVPTNVAIAFLGRAHPSHDHATIGGATRARCRCSRVRQTSR